MNCKPIGLKTKRMGMKWMWVDDQISLMNAERIHISRMGLGGSDFVQPTLMFNSLNNITFEIPEGPELSRYEPDKLIIDEAPKLLTKSIHRTRKHKQEVAKSFDFSKNSLEKPRKTPEKNNESHRLKNLYYYLHTYNQGSLTEKQLKLNERHSRLQDTLQSIHFSKNYKKYLHNHKLRVPGCLKSID